jgi:hypothetical protein
MTILFDSAAAVNVDNVFFAQDLLPPTVFTRTVDDQPSPEDSLEWYQTSDPSDPADWDADDLAMEQAMLEDARACGLID